MKPFSDGNTLWIPLAYIAREFNKHPFTVRKWCASGFILSLGYRTRRDPKGHWFVAPLTENVIHVNCPAELRVS